MHKHGKLVLKEAFGCHLIVIDNKKMIYNKKLVLVNKEEESSIFNTKDVQDKHLPLILENYMTSILYRSDIDFDVFTAKLFVLVLWVSYSLEDQPGNEILTSDLIQKL